MFQNLEYHQKQIRDSVCTWCLLQISSFCLLKPLQQLQSMINSQNDRKHVRKKNITTLNYGRARV